MRQAMVGISGRSGAGTGGIARGIVGLSRNCVAMVGLQQLLSTRILASPAWQHVGVRMQRNHGAAAEWCKMRRRGGWRRFGAVALGFQMICLSEQKDESVKGLVDVGNKPSSCTADELHFVGVPGTDWRLALWRYRPALGAPLRNHPVLMLSGIGTNAIGFDLDPTVSLARYTSTAGFDTWILEVRGAGLGVREGKESSSGNGAVKEAAVTDNNSCVEEKSATAGKSSVLDKASDGADSSTGLSDTIWGVLEQLKGLVNQGQSRFLSARFVDQITSLLEEGRISEFRKQLSAILEEAQNSTIASQIADTRNRLAKLLEEGQLTVSPRVSDLQERMSAIVDEYQRILDLIANFDWDFDHYLEEDVPAAMDYILGVSKTSDGKILGIGHSMGGILFYALLATRGEKSRVAAVVTVASSLDYGVSDTSLKYLLPLADPSRLLNVPVVPLGALMAAAHPLVTRAPYALSWLGHQVSANGNMDPELFGKLVLNNFGTVPVKLLLHLSTVFKPGGLKNRDGTLIYKEALQNNRVPVLALAADQDYICPPVAVIDTANVMPKDVVTVKLFGSEGGRHYGHYDLLVSRWAREEVYPCILEFLLKNDGGDESAPSVQTKSASAT